MKSIWIARDNDGSLNAYTEEPRKNYVREDFRSRNGENMKLHPNSFPEVTWENSPFEVELVIKEKGGLTMERKIGEIFEHKGEWYQCVEGTGCYKCDLYFNGNTCTAKNPHCACRSDWKNVVYKKLEKVGEPYLAHYHSRNKYEVVQDYKLYNQHACYNGHEEMLCFGRYGRNDIVTIKSKDPIKSLNCENSAEIQIKKTKEDMEEKKIQLRQEDVDWLKDKIRWSVLPGYSIAYEEDYDKIVEEMMKLFTSSNTKHSNSENIEKNLKPFNLEAAKAGKPVCTRDGRKARIICFDRRLFYKNVSYPILALVECYDGEDDVCGYNEKGKVLIEDGAEYKDDLMMLPEKKEGWVNVYKDSVYDTKDEALIGRSESRGYIDTIKINWEE